MLRYRNAAGSRGLAVAGWLVLGLLPYVGIYVAHAWDGRGRPTGFLLYDTPYYVAAGREIFERGHGLAPSAARAEARRIRQQASGTSKLPCIFPSHTPSSARRGSPSARRSSAIG